MEKIRTMTATSGEHFSPYVYLAAGFLLLVEIAALIQRGL